MTGKLLFIIVCLGMHQILFSQTVENIRVDQEGENIRITYRIGESSEDELYKVTLECSMDGKSNFEPKSVLGDVGNNIIGGKSYYTIIWEVFKDIDEVDEAEFFIRVDRMSGKKASSDISDAKQSDIGNPHEGNNLFMFRSNIPTSFLGLGYSYLGNWGGYLAFNSDFSTTQYEAYLVSAGITKKFMANFHFYLGFGLDLHYLEKVIDLGFIYRLDKISLSLGGGYNMDDTSYSFGSLGIGINF